MLSKQFINQVKQATDMVKLAKQYTELKLVGEGIWQGVCPHPDHKDDTPSFTVWENTQSWACMGCHSGKKDIKHKNYGSDCIAFIQWIEGMKWREAVLHLAKEAGIEPEKEKHAEVYDHNLKLALSYHKNMHSNALNYLFERGLSEKDVEDWMIGFDGSRIVFPLFDNFKRVLGFTKRKFVETDKNSPKYRNSRNGKVFNKGSYLYGIHLLEDDCDEIRITEGAMDVIVSSKYGVKNIVATLGTAFTENHIDLIKNIGKTPVFCMDNDEAGIKAVKKSVELLSKHGIYTKILVLPDNMDMADLANLKKEETENFIQNHAITYGHMMIQEVINQYDAKVNEIKLRIYPELKKILSTIPTEDERKIIKDFIYERTGLKL